MLVKQKSIFCTINLNLDLCSLHQMLSELCWTAKNNLLPTSCGQNFNVYLNCVALSTPVILTSMDA